MTTITQRVRECWRLASHYRGQITSASLLARAVFAAWRTKTLIVRMSHFGLERQPAPLNYGGHTFSPRSWRT